MKTEKKDLTSNYCFFQGQATELTGGGAGTSPPQKKSAMEALFGETFAGKEDTGKKPFLDVIEEEVAYYRAASGIPIDGDPLNWWKTNEGKYPHVAMMAKCYLAVPGTSVPSDRVFSTEGDIVTAKRSTLSPGIADILIFLKKSLKL